MLAECRVLCVSWGSIVCVPGILFNRACAKLSCKARRPLVSTPNFTHPVTFCCDFVSGNRNVHVARALVVS